MMGIDKQEEIVTGTGTMNHTFAPGKEFVFEEVRLHLNEVPTTEQDFVITLVSSKGDVYNVKLYSKDMNAVQDVVYQPENPHEFISKDSLTFTWANANSKIWGMEIIYRAAL